MERYKDRSRARGVMMPIDLEDQIVPETFEHTIDYLVDNEIDLSVFEHRYNNDDTAARRRWMADRSQPARRQRPACRRRLRRCGSFSREMSGVAEGGQSPGDVHAGANREPDIDLAARTSRNTDGSVQPVATLAPNDLGIYDLSGNVFVAKVFVMTRKSTPVRTVWDGMGLPIYQSSRCDGIPRGTWHDGVAYSDSARRTARDRRGGEAGPAATADGRDPRIARFEPATSFHQDAR